MNREEARGLAEELGKQVAVAAVLGGVSTSRIGPLVEVAVSQALDRAITPTRIASAERAVVEHALDERLGQQIHRSDCAIYSAQGDGCECGVRAWLDKLSRLRDLRETIGREECAAVKLAGVRSTDGNVNPKATNRMIHATCHLPRGHVNAPDPKDREHSGLLGELRWRDG